MIRSITQRWNLVHLALATQTLPFLVMEDFFREWVSSMRKQGILHTWLRLCICICVQYKIMFLNLIVYAQSHFCGYGSFRNIFSPFGVLEIKTLGLRTFIKTVWHPHN